MENETIKQYTPITVEQAGEMLQDNGWKPVGGLSFWNDSNHRQEGMLHGIDLTANTKFRTMYSPYLHCATVTELDPCQAPDGCPELEPWMAYVGKGKDLIGVKPSTKILFNSPFDDEWISSSACPFESNLLTKYAIDVRTDWAKEHFPEHCRIRNYQEPDAFEEWIKRRGIPAKGMTWEEILREAYELGQANPNQPTK